MIEIIIIGLFIIIFIIVILLLLPEKCKKCGNRKTSLYMPDGTDLNHIGYYCENCDNDFIQDFYSGKFEKTN